MLRVVSVQPSIVLGKPELNQEHIKYLLEPIRNRLIDMIILPEMAITGYVFPEKKGMHDLAEVCGQGPQFAFFAQLAVEYKAYVFAGYPERVSDTEYYNSMYCIDRSGNLIVNYRKHCLYEEDKRYFLAGEKFKTLEVTTLGGRTLKVVPAICMDLNYSSPEKYFDYELATFCKEEEADAIVFLANWLKGDTVGNYMIKYWVQRLEPLVGDGTSGKQVHFLCANRIGIEGGITFVGLSCHLGLNPVKLINQLDNTQSAIVMSAIPLN